MNWQTFVLIFAAAALWATLIQALLHPRVFAVAFVLPTLLFIRLLDKLTHGNVYETIMSMYERRQEARDADERGRA